MRANTSSHVNFVTVHRVACSINFQQAKMNRSLFYGVFIMIYKFKSQAAADVIMLEISGDHILFLLGREPSPQGIITVEQIPAAIAALEKAFDVHLAETIHDDKPLLPQEDSENDGVTIFHRITPFLELLRTSAQEGKDVVWGV
jgi:hypothetical protein